MKKSLGHTDNRLILEVVKRLIEWPTARVCRHYVAATILNYMEQGGFPLTGEFAKAVVDADDEAAKKIVNELLK